MPSPITMDVPMSTKSKRSVFRCDLCSNASFIFKALSSSGVGNLSLKLEICSSAGWRFGRRLTFAYLQINEYNANVPPAKPWTISKLLHIYRSKLLHIYRLKPWTISKDKKTINNNILPLHKNSYLPRCHWPSTQRKHTWSREWEQLCKSLLIKPPRYQHPMW